MTEKILGLHSDANIQTDIKFSVRVGYINCSRNVHLSRIRMYEALDLVAVDRTFVQMNAVDRARRSDKALSAALWMD